MDLVQSSFNNNFAWHGIIVGGLVVSFGNARGNFVMMETLSFPLTQLTGASFHLLCKQTGTHLIVLCGFGGSKYS